MRVAFYIQMFGMNGRNLLSYLWAHRLVHYHDDIDLINKRVRLDETRDIVKESGADLVSVSEILDFNKSELDGDLRNIGYKSVHFGNGHRLKYFNNYEMIGIACKCSGRNLEVSGFPVRDEMRGGGGVVGMELNGVNYI